MAHAMPRHWKIANPMLTGSEDSESAPSSERNAPLCDIQQFMPTAPQDQMPDDIARMVGLHEQLAKKHG